MTQEENAVQPTVDNFEVLGIPKNFEMTSGNLLTVFKDRLEKTKNKNLLVSVKNDLLRTIVTKQMKARNYFTIESPFKHPCTACKGTGEIYKFSRGTKEVRCHVCGGEDLKIPCRSCNGTGRFVRQYEDGGKINVVCKICDGTGILKVKCSVCLGEGVLRKTTIIPEIESTTPCQKCEQLGFINPPKPKTTNKEVMNPVLDQEIAASLSEKIHDSK